MDKKNNNTAPITKETQHAFFDGVVRGIRDTKAHIVTNKNGSKSLRFFAPNSDDTPDDATGLLETFSKPLHELNPTAEGSKPEEDFSFPFIHYNNFPRNTQVTGARIKPPHTDESKNTPGTVWHVGDEAYNGVTHEILDAYGKPCSIQKHHITDKMRGINHAIAHYMPDDVFSQYLAFFRENLDTPLHREALKNSFKVMQEQIEGRDMHNFPDVSSDKLNEILKNNGREQSSDSKKNIILSEDRLDLAQHPDLVLAMAVFHAAHGAYVSQLGAAFDRAKERSRDSGGISEDEHDNAKFTVDSVSFQQFSHFLLFSNLGPLIMHEYSALEESGADDTARKKQAIGNAWDVFFDKHILTRHIEPHKIPPTEENPKGGAIQTCPARKHLKTSSTMNLLEDTFEYIDQHSRGSKYMEQAQKEINTALRIPQSQVR